MPLKHRTHHYLLPMIIIVLQHHFYKIFSKIFGAQSQLRQFWGYNTKDNWYWSMNQRVFSSENRILTRTSKSELIAEMKKWTGNRKDLQLPSAVCFWFLRYQLKNKVEWTGIPNYITEASTWFKNVGRGSGFENWTGESEAAIRHTCKVWCLNAVGPVVKIGEEENLN